MLQFKLAKRCHSSFLHPSKFSTSSSLEFVSPDTPDTTRTKTLKKHKKKREIYMLTQR